jgi:hypothetical protein
LIAPAGSGSVTTADSVEIIVTLPSEFRAVTLNRSFAPTSLWLTR